MLMFFLLYEMQKGTQSEWFHLLNNLPKDLDYVVFWPDSDLEKLEDAKLLKMV